MEFEFKRIYEIKTTEAGFRILIDRLWPRGISKTDAKIDLWPKEICPSSQLRKSFHSGEMSYSEFTAAYRLELESNDAASDFISNLKERAPEKVLILSAVKDVEHSHIPVLLHFILDNC